MNHPPVPGPGSRTPPGLQRRARMRVAAMAFAGLMAVGMVTAVVLGRGDSGDVPTGPAAVGPGILAARATEQPPPVPPPAAGSTVAESTPGSEPAGDPSPAEEPSPVQSAGSPAVFTFSALADLKGRAAPALDARVVKDIAYPIGTPVPVVCQLTGGEAFGSTIWDLTADGYYVTDSYVDTGHLVEVPGIPTCPSP